MILFALYCTGLALIAAALAYLRAQKLEEDGPDEGFRGSHLLIIFAFLLLWPLWGTWLLAVFLTALWDE